MSSWKWLKARATKVPVISGNVSKDHTRLGTQPVYRDWHRRKGFASSRLDADGPLHSKIFTCPLLLLLGFLVFLLGPGCD